MPSFMCCAWITLSTAMQIPCPGTDYALTVACQQFTESECTGDCTWIPETLSPQALEQYLELRAETGACACPSINCSCVMLMQSISEVEDGRTLSWVGVVVSKWLPMYLVGWWGVRGRYGCRCKLCTAVRCLVCLPDGCVIAGGLYRTRGLCFPTQFAPMLTSFSDYQAL
jgi:hypothetical protein